MSQKTNKKYCDNIAIWAGNYLGWHTYAGNFYNFSSFYLLDKSGTFGNVNFFNDFALTLQNDKTGIYLIRTKDEVYKNLHWTSSDDFWHYYQLWGYKKNDKQINVTFDNRTPEGFILNNCYPEYIGSSVSGWKIKLTTSSTATFTHSISATGTWPLAMADYYLNYYFATTINSSLSAYLVHTGNSNPNPIFVDPPYEKLIDVVGSSSAGTKNIHIGNLIHSSSGGGSIIETYDKLQFRFKKTGVPSTTYVYFDNIQFYDNGLYANADPKQISKESTMWINGGSTGKYGYRVDTSNSINSPFDTDMLNDPINLGETDYAYFGNYAQMLSYDIVKETETHGKYKLYTYEEVLKDGYVFDNYSDLLKSNTLNKIEIVYDGILENYEKTLIKFVGSDSFLNGTSWTITSTEVNYNDEISTIKLNKVLE